MSQLVSRSLIFFVSALAILPALLFADSDVSTAELPALLLFFGRLHPIFVHFPISLVVIGALVELVRLLRGKRIPSRISHFCFLWSCVAGLMAIAAGWVNGWSSNLQGQGLQTLEIHRWLSIAAILLASICALLASSALRSPNKRIYLSYVFLALLSAGLIGAAAHFGGIMVHGEDYFSEVFEPKKPAAQLAFSVSESELQDLSPVKEPMQGLPEPLLRPVDFKQEIYPLLKRSCYRCHGGGKDKGDYRIDSREDFIRSGESGPAVVPGRSDLSYLIMLVAGLDPHEVMPEKGRKLTPSEIALLRAFIDQQVPWDSSGKTDALMRARLELSKVEVPESKQQRPLDALLEQYFKANNLKIPEKVSDAIFARRASLDITGFLPGVQEVRQLEQAQDPEKRRRFVESLLKQERAYTDNWLSFWNDLLRNDYSGAGFIGGNREQITGWLRRALLKNMPYDKMVSELVAPGPRASGFIKGIMWKGGAVSPNERVEMQAAQNIGQAFLGINLKCASCHDSFTDEWTLQDSYGIASIYAQSPLEVHECDKPTGKTVAPRFIFPELGKISKGLDIKDRTKEFAELLTQPDNGRFARTIVNRIWAKLIGRGIISPVDEMGAEPWSLEVLDWLARDFIEHDFDLKHLIAQILNSTAYQLPATEVENLDAENYVFSGPLVRKISAEQFVDNFAKVTGAWLPFSRSDMLRLVQFAPAKTSKRKHEKNLSAFSEPRKIEIDISGARSLWLVTNAREKNKRGNNPFSGYGVWADPILVGADNTKPLTDIYWEQAFSKRAQPGDMAAEIKSDFSLGEKRFKAALLSSPFSVVHYNLGDHDYKTLELTLAVHDPQGLQEGESKSARLEFMVFSDLDVRSAYFEENPLMNALGRPVREQIVSRRDDQLNTMQALMFANGREASKMFRDAARNLANRKWQSSAQLVSFLFEGFLGRAPTATELKDSLELVGQRRIQEQGLEDLIWAIVLLPEFQLIV